MPIYNYHCPVNGLTLEVQHSMKEDLTTWAQLCEKAGCGLGETSADAPVERILYPVGLATPRGDAKLKELGFTKLVRRDKGVYENVTALDGEKRFMKADDPSSYPDIKRRVGD